MSTPRPHRRLAPVIWLLAMLVCGWIIASTPVATDLTLFIPRNDPVAELLLEQLRSGSTTRLILIGLSGDSENARATTSRQLAIRLRESALFSNVANGTETLPETELQTLFTHRYLLSPAITTDHFSAVHLHQALQQRLRELQSPLGLLQKRWLAADPSGELLRLTDLWSGGGTRQPPKRQGVWFSPNGHYAVLFAETHASGYDLAAQRIAVNTILTAFATASDTNDVQLAMTGTGVLATLAEKQIRTEASLLGALAMIAMILMLLLVYRSARTLWLGALPMISALVVGAATVGLLFGQIYMITLAFSMTLLGETLDYPTYLFSHRQTDTTVTETLQQIWPTLRLCVITTLLGCLAMIVGEFPGLSQLGVFTVAGIIAAVLTTRWLLPALVTAHWTPPYPGNVGDWAERLLQPRPKLALIFGCSGLILLPGLLVKAPTMWQDNLAALSPVPDDLLSLDRALRSASGAPEVGHLIAILAPDAETVLRHSEAVAAYLDTQKTNRVLDEYDGAMRYLPSQHTQRQHQQMLPDTRTLVANLNTALHGLPFQPDVFQPFIVAVATARTAPLVTPDTLGHTRLATRINALLFPNERGWTALLPLSGVHDPDRLAQGLPDHPSSQVLYLNLRAETNRLVAGFREAILMKLIGGGALIIAIIWIGLRCWRRVAVSLLPVFLGLVVTITVVLALDERLTLFHLVALLLVLGIGVDYGLFFSRPNTSPALRRHALHALLVCCASAFTVFGLLSTSDLPALHAIGLTVSLGVATSFIMALVIAQPLLKSIDQTHKTTPTHTGLSP